MGEVEGRVFISFATPNGDRALDICDSLESRGFRCWISLRDLVTGSRYGDEIIQQIRSSDALVLVLSEAANRSEFVHREVERAVNYRIPVFPVRLEDVEPGATLELFISANQWIDVWHGDFAAQMDRLAADIGREARAGEEDGDRRAHPRPPSFPPRGGSRSRWLMRYGGLAAAALAVAVFGILNLYGTSESVPSEDPVAADTAGRVAENMERPPVEEAGEEQDDGALADGVVSDRRGEDRAADRAAKEAPAGAAPVRPADGVLVAVRGPQGSGAGTVETILLSELSERGQRSLDRVAIGPATPTGGTSVHPDRLTRLRAEHGVSVVVLGDLRTEATRSLGSMYTGRATLSVRSYDTESGRLLRTETFQVGADGTPGKLGASSLAAASQAAVQVAHQAAARLAGQMARDGARH